MNKKTVIAVLFTVLMTSNAHAKYDTAEEIFGEWLILNTCVEFTKSEKIKKPSVDGQKALLNCVKKAKKNEAKEKGQSTLTNYISI
ncbi:MAG: hypothetical protein HRU38_23485 [Saccharospirillaceae bacterium]|nr:hypothetical protein [Saccharospirillaceae bacterium]